MSRAPILIVLVMVVGLVVLVSSNSSGDGLQVGGGSADEQPLSVQDKPGNKDQANSGEERAPGQGATQQGRPASAKPTSGCGARVLGPEATAVQPPPVPSVKATRVGQNARVTVRFLATPAQCRPAVVDVRVTPLGNPMGGAGAGLVQVQGNGGSVLVQLPRGSSPPYEVRVIALTATGAPSSPLLLKLP